MIDGTTKLLGIIGYPVTYSLSPVMQNAAIAALHENYVYLPFPLQGEYLAQAIQGFAAIGVVGFNVTIPHKQAILPYLDTVSDLAQGVGAVNTVYRRDGQWFGTNTDVLGFLAALPTRSWAGCTAVVLGNGGAARAVVAGCVQMGFDQVWVVGRNPDKLLEFQRSWANSSIAAKLAVCPWEQLSDRLPQASLVVNTTPIGMDTSAHLSPLTLGQWQQVPEGAIAYDLIYTPRPTQFLKEAQARDLTTIDGVEMLVQQGAAALELWLHRHPPIEVMRQALLARLPQP